MKKNINIITIEPSLLNYLLGSLRDAPSNVAAAELAEAVAELQNGGSDSLLLATGAANNAESAASSVITCRELAIYPRSRKVIRSGTELTLTPKEFDILYFLARNRGQVFTKEQIYQAVWEDKYLLDDSNIMAFIRKLRKKVEPNPDAPEFIQTIWGIGYKFTDDE